MIGLVLNPNAHYVRKRPQLADHLRRIAAGRAVIVETRTPDELDQVARDFASREIELVAICGGDGTNLATLTALARAYGRDRLPTVAMLRGGTVNTVAANLRVRGTPEQILDRLFKKLDAGELPERGQDLLEVNGMLGFLFAAAMGARFLEAYYGGPYKGVAWAALLASRTAFSSLTTGNFARWLFAPVPLELDIDGQRIDRVRAPRLLLASTVPDVGIGMKVTWQAGRQPNRFHLVASNLPTVKMALQLHRVLSGRPLAGGTTEAPHLDVLAQSARIRFAEPESFTLDGDLFKEREVTIAVGPRVMVARP